MGLNLTNIFFVNLRMGEFTLFRSARIVQR